MKRGVSVVALVFACGIDASRADPQVPPCAGGWLSVQAMVTRISPGTAKVSKRAGAGPVTDLKVAGVLCEGESLLFANAADGSLVELYEAGKVVVVEARYGSYTVKSGVHAALSAAASYVNAALSGASDLGPPPARPSPTGVRGDAASAQDAARQVRPILPLRGLPRQKVSVGARLIVGWRDGVAPYSCEVHDDDGPITSSRTSTSQGWCEMPADLRRAVRLVVRDGVGRSTGWNIAVITESQVPRPQWLPAGAGFAPGTDQTAWAIWLWQHGGPEWRLQALGMLNASAGSEFLAGYFVDRVLAEVPPIAHR